MYNHIHYALSALSRRSSWRSAGKELLDAFYLKGGEPPQLGILFATWEFRRHFWDLAELLQRETGAYHFVGVLSKGIIGDGAEVEAGPAASLWVGSLPQGSFSPCHISYLPEEQSFHGLVEDASSAAHLILAVDPYTFPCERFLKWINRLYPELSASGGVASGVNSPFEAAFYLNGEVYTHGALGVLVQGAKVRTIVSQGCRPVGKYMVITQAEENIIYRIGGKPALEKLQEMLLQVSFKEHLLLGKGIHLGIATNAAKDSFHMGDFLVRSVVGVYEPEGALLVNDYVRPGLTVQFHVRDSRAAENDLIRHLKAVCGRNYLGGLLFLCHGRGRQLFSEPSHDLSLVHRYLGSIPVGGFFSAGEIAFLDGKNRFHNFTAVLTLFEES